MLVHCKKETKEGQFGCLCAGHFVGLLLTGLYLGWIRHLPMSCEVTRKLYWSFLCAGHFAGLLTGLYLGWGLAPAVPPPKDPRLLPGAGAERAKLGEAGSGSVTDPHLNPDPIPSRADPAVLEELRRWAGYAAFAASLALVTAGAVVARTGQLPIPKGPALEGFLGRGLL